MSNYTVKQSYEEYVKKLRDNVYAEEGEIVTCQRGHVCTEFLCTSYVDEVIMLSDCKSESLKEIGQNPFICNECDAPFVKVVSNKNAIKFGTGFQFWIDGEWRVKKYK